MLQELNIAGSLLNSALDRYLGACVAVQKHYRGQGSFAAVPPELSSRVDFEAQLVTALDVKLRRAKSAISWARNCSTTLVPIHILPQELLARVFLYISRMQCDESFMSGLHVKNPEVVSHVCSRWRDLALNLPTFWSIIRLRPVGDPAKMARAIAFAERANSLPLHLQLYDDGSPFPTSFRGSVAQLSEVVPAISPRIRSLHLVVQTDRYHRALSDCLGAACKIGVKTLITSSYNSRLEAAHKVGFFDLTTNLPLYLPNNSYTIREAIPDHSMASIDTLRLKGLYPFWTSLAYHGLVELRLNHHEFTSVPISESHLVGILRASPALCFLEFDLEIVESLPANALISPVRIDCLKSLVLGLTACRMFGTLVRWLSPGLNPLQLSLYDDDGATLQLPDASSNDGAALFSNVREIHAIGLVPWQIVNLIDRCPNLTTLALDDCDLFRDLEGPDSSVWHPFLESIFVLNCVVEQHAFSNLITGNSPALRNFLFWECSRCADGPGDYLGLDAHDLSYLAGICPNVRVIGYNPIQEWAVYN